MKFFRLVGRFLAIVVALSLFEVSPIGDGIASAASATDLYKPSSKHKVRDWTGVLKRPVRGISQTIRTGPVTVSNVDGSGTTEYFVVVGEQLRHKLDADVGHAVKKLSEGVNDAKWEKTYRSLADKAFKADQKRFESIIESQNLAMTAREAFDAVESSGYGDDRRGRLYGIRTADGRSVLPAEYLSVRPLSDRYIWVVHLDRSEHIIDLDGQTHRPYVELDALNYTGKYDAYGNTAPRVYVLHAGDTADGFNAFMPGLDGTPIAIFPKLIGTWETRNGPTAFTYLPNKRFLAFGRLNGLPITYTVIDHGDMYVAPGVQHELISDGQVKHDHWRYGLLRASGELARSVGHPSRLYYDVVDPFTLETVKSSDPDYIGVMPINYTRPSKARGAVGPLPTDLLLIYSDASGDYDFRIAKLGQFRNDDNRWEFNSVIRVLETDQSFMRLDDVHLPIKSASPGESRAIKTADGRWHGWFYTDGPGLESVDSLYYTGRPNRKYLNLALQKTRVGTSKPALFQANELYASRMADAKRYREEQSRLYASMRAASDMRQSQMLAERNALVERSRQSAQSASQSGPTIWQQISPFKADGTYKTCYRKREQVECYD